MKTAFYKPQKYQILRAVLIGGSVPFDVLRRVIGIPKRTLSHHLNALRTKGWIVSSRRGSTWIWSPADREALYAELWGFEARTNGHRQGAPKLVDNAASLGKARVVARRRGDLVRFIEANPGLPRADIAAAMGVSAGTITEDVRVLKGRGKVHVVREGTLFLNYPGPSEAFKTATGRGGEWKS